MPCRSKAGTPTGQQAACGERPPLPESTISLCLRNCSFAQGWRMGLLGSPTAIAEIQPTLALGAKPVGIADAADKGVAPEQSRLAKTGTAKPMVDFAIAISFSRGALTLHPVRVRVKGAHRPLTRD